MIRKTKEFLARDIVQRWLYAIVLIIWLIPVVLDFFDPRRLQQHGVSGRENEVLLFYSIPALLLGIQIIRNNKIVWALMLAVAGLLTLNTAYFVCKSLFYGNFLLKYDLTLLVYFFVLSGSSLILFYMKPGRLL